MRAREEPRRMERIRKHKLGQHGHGLLAPVVVLGLCEEIVYKEGRLELCVPTWRTEWPSCLGLNPVFPRCSKTVFEAGPGLEAASSTQPADKQRDGITFAVGLGRLLGWEASEVTEGQARGTHQRRRPRGHRRQQQNELADEESLAAHLSVLRAVQFSLSKCREAPVPLPAKTPIAPPPPALRHRHPSSEGGRARAGRGRP